MIIDAFKSINVYQKAINAASMRQEAITSNIANADTPGYKRKDVVFESMLQDALRMNGNDINKVNLGNIKATIVTDKKALSYRMDGNNVNIDTETVEAAKNQLRYNMLIDRVNGSFERLSTSMKNR